MLNRPKSYGEDSFVVAPPFHTYHALKTENGLWLYIGFNYFEVTVDFVKGRVDDCQYEGARKFFTHMNGHRIMAENESLDLNSPNARRWDVVGDAARKGCSCQQVGSITRMTFLKAIRKVVRQFEEYGVTTADFFTVKDSPTDLKRLVRLTKHHPYAELLVTVMDTYPGTSPADCLKRWGNAILDTVFDQISLDLGGSEEFPSFFNTRSFFRRVRDELRDDLNTVAVRLAANPHWKPIARTKKGESRFDPTASQLPVSLIGGPKR